MSKSSGGFDPWSFLSTDISDFTTVSRNLFFPFYSAVLCRCEHLLIDAANGLDGVV